MSELQHNHPLQFLEWSKIQLEEWTESHKILEPNTRN